MSHIGNDERRDALFFEWQNEMLLRYDRMPGWWNNSALRNKAFDNHCQQLEGLEANQDA